MNTPILFLIFNRPDVTKKVFEQIKMAKPPKLYVAADGARSEEEKLLCEETRSIINEIDWDCELKTLFREENLGCKENVSSAIDWFFENEEMGIILEDDLMAHPDFFRFCSDLLEYYKDDERVWAITGTNLIEQTDMAGDYSYLFSGYGGCWGWASWRRAWKHFDKDLKLWPEVRDSQLLRWVYTEDYKYNYWYDICESIYNNTAPFNSWAYPWAFTRRINSGLTIVPAKNLVSNIGFGEQSTHTTDQISSLANISIYEIEFPLKHPPYVCRNMKFDELHGQKNYYTHIPQEESRKKKFSIFKKLKKVLNEKSGRV